MIQPYAECPAEGCIRLVKPWPDQKPFCCHNCWQHFYTTYLRPDLAHEVQGLAPHSEQCADRQITRMRELDDATV
jgi:hypothetical protein